MWFIAKITGLGRCNAIGTKHAKRTPREGVREAQR
jgi:hypothetical protein